MFRFEVTHCDPRSRARTGRLTTPHGAVQTPAFMPVGTKGSVKGVTVDQLRLTGTQMILANTYHLQLRPGPEVVESLGGLHRFTGWDGPILTDSGGYQVYSLADLATIDDDAVHFRSHIDGARLSLGPESAVRIQNQLGADIIVALDQCPPYPCPRQAVEQALERTVRWAARCKIAHQREDQWLFGIVQGGVHADLRRRCCEQLIEMDFPGLAVGGLSVGEPRDLLIEVLEGLGDLLPEDKPRYLMGVGMPRDMVAAIRCGIDLFDCVLPTRNGRNAYAFTRTGPVRLRNEKHKTATDPIEPGCDCYACRTASLGYIRHLFLAEEMLGPILVSIHNLRFFHQLTRRIRELIRKQKLETIYAEYPVTRPEAGSNADEKE